MEAIAVELDDDVFFADLSKQISLLIMDDDDEDHLVTHSPSVSLQGFSQSIHHPAAHQLALPFVYNNHQDHQQTCKRESKGTGVFIPRSLISQPRRKSRQGKSTYYNTTTTTTTSSHPKLQKNQENSRGLLPHAVPCNLKGSYYDSFNPRRF